MKKVTTKAGKPALKATATLRQSILELVDLKNSKSIRPFDLRGLGYVLGSGSKVTFGSSHELWRVLDADTRREVSFCLLISTSTNMGIVVPKPYGDLVEDQV